MKLILFIIGYISFFLLTNWAKNLVVEDGHLKFYGIRVSYIFSPKKWYEYIQGMCLNYFMPPHILEQIFIRQITCSDCVENGKCLDCGCKMPAKTLSFSSRCSLDKWVEIENDPKKYKDWKEKYKVKLSVSYGESI